MWEIFGGGKYWQICGNSSHFYPPNVLVLPSKIACKSKFANNYYFTIQKLRKCVFTNILPLQIFPTDGNKCHRDKQEVKYYRPFNVQCHNRCMLLYIANHLRWKRFAVLVDQSVPRNFSSEIVCAIRFGYARLPFNCKSFPANYSLVL